MRTSQLMGANPPALRRGFHDLTVELGVAENLLYAGPEANREYLA